MSHVRPELPTPQQIYADRGWRWRQSSWLLFPTVGICCFGWVGFAIVAARSGWRSYWLWTAIYAVLAMGLPIAGSEAKDDTAIEDALYGTWLAAIAIIALHAVLINSRYLKRLAQRQVSAFFQYAAMQPPQWGPGVLPHAGVPHAEPGFLGLNQGNYWAGQTPPTPPHPAPQANFGPPDPAPMRPESASLPPGRRVDVNTATAEDFAKLPGLNSTIGAELVRAREARGGFTQTDELIAHGGLQPHLWLGIRDLVEVTTPRQTPPHEQPGQGRILDF